MPTAQENTELLSAYRAAPTVANRNRIVSANLGLVEKAADRFAHLSRIPYDDLYSVGVVGLIKAVERFDLTTGYRFSSYAMPRIRGEMLHYQRDREQPGGMRIPRAWIDRRSAILAGNYEGIRTEDRRLASMAVQYKRPLSLDYSTDDDDTPAVQIIAPAHPDNPLTLDDILETMTDIDETQYFNATTICKRYGRSVHRWRQTATAQKLIAAWETKNRADSAVISQRGRKGETWIHRDLSADFLRWVHPEAAALVCYAYSAAVAERLS